MLLYFVLGFVLLFYFYLGSVRFLLKHGDNERALGGLHDFVRCVSYMEPVLMDIKIRFV